jgi:hypothetical protein
MVAEGFAYLELIAKDVTAHRFHSVNRANSCRTCGRVLWRAGAHIPPSRFTHGEIVRIGQPSHKLVTAGARPSAPACLGARRNEEASVGLSPTTITRLLAAWQKDYDNFCKRDLQDSVTIPSD